MLQVFVVSDLYTHVRMTCKILTFHTFPIGTLFYSIYIYSIAVLDSGRHFNFKVTNNEHHYYETRLKLKYRKKSIKRKWGNKFYDR